jgi:AP-3 complex subunit mu
VPPDGKFKLFEFQGATSQNRSLPLALKTGLVVEENGGELDEPVDSDNELIPGRFSLTLSSKVNRIVEDIVISIHLGSGATSASATATGDRPPMSMGGPTGAGKRQDAAAEGFAGGGNWEFDPHSRVSFLHQIRSES